MYADDEQGFTGEEYHRAGGDDGIRPAFPSHPSELAPGGRDILAEHKHLIRQRQLHPWRTHATATPSSVANGSISIDLVAADNRLALGLNATDAPVQLQGSRGALTVEPHGWALD